jgi:outer membrane lipoprotein carrier protein
MFKSLVACFLLSIAIATPVLAQPKPAGTAPAETNDPKAKALLDKLRKQYEAYKSMELAFTLTIEQAEKPKEVQKGKLIQQGVMFFLDTDKQAVYCDGKTLWMHAKKENEVQLNTFDGKTAGGIMSPREMVKLYQSNDYLYAIVGSGTESGKKCTFVEFKPKKRNGQFTKMRMSIDAATTQIVNVKVFSPDGSRYTMAMSAVIANKGYAATIFSFNKAKFPGIKVEDLRED